MLAFDGLDGHLGVSQCGFDLREISLHLNLLFADEDHLLLQLLLDLLGGHFLFLGLQRDKGREQVSVGTMMRPGSELMVAEED